MPRKRHASVSLEVDISPPFSPFPGDVRDEIERYLATPYEQRIIHRKGKKQHRPAAEPPAWGLSIPDTEEGTLSWFEGGNDVTMRCANTPENIYQNFVTGIFIGNFQQSNSYCDSEILIIGLNDHSCDVRMANQRADAMQSNIRNHHYLGVLMRKANTTFGLHNLELPCELPPSQSVWVLDWFCPVSMWPQKNSAGSGAPITWMVKLQKHDLDVPSWWSNPLDDPQPLEKRAFSPQTINQACFSCGQTFANIFEVGFMCLNEHCDKWWALAEDIGEERKYTPLEGRHDLTYSDAFLQERTNASFFPLHGKGYHDLTAEPQPIVHSWTKVYEFICHTALQIPVELNALTQFSTMLKCGFVCPQCGMMSGRILWAGWRCYNTKCSQHTHIYGCPKLRLSLGQILQLVPQQASQIPLWRRPASFLLTTSGGGNYTTTGAIKLPGECYMAVARPAGATNGMVPNHSDYLFYFLRDCLGDGVLPALRVGDIFASQESDISDAMWNAHVPQEYLWMRHTTNQLFSILQGSGNYFTHLAISAFLPNSRKTGTLYADGSCNAMAFWHLGGHGNFTVMSKNPSVDSANVVFTANLTHGSVVFLFGPQVFSRYSYVIQASGPDMLMCTLRRR